MLVSQSPLLCCDVYLLCGDDSLGTPFTCVIFLCRSGGAAQVMQGCLRGEEWREINASTLVAAAGDDFIPSSQGWIRSCRTKLFPLYLGVSVRQDGTGWAKNGHGRMLLSGLGGASKVGGGHFHLTDWPTELPGTSFGKDHDVHACTHFFFANVFLKIRR